jgi:hypothetical protein
MLNVKDFHDYNEVDDDDGGGDDDVHEHCYLLLFEYYDVDDEMENRML